MPDVPTSSANGWHEWSRYVLKELERLATAEESLRKEIIQFRLDVSKDITSLKAQAGFWGATAGVVFGIVATIVTKLLTGY